MYAALVRIYSSSKNEVILTNAVKKGWITSDQKAEIISQVA